MRRITIILLLLPMFAMAEHHRGHSLDLLQRVDNSLALIETYLTEYMTTAEEEDKNKLGSLRYRIGLVRVKNAAIKIILKDPYGDLETVRSMVQQPGYNTPPGSIAKFYYGFNSSWEVLAYWDDLDDNIVGRQLAYSTFTYTRLAWHINDAVREEVYLDQSFICSGANNHCE